MRCADPNDLQPFCFNRIACFALLCFALLCWLEVLCSGLLYMAEDSMLKRGFASQKTLTG